MPATARQTSTHSTHSADLPPAQAQFLAAMAQGLTITAAAESAGVHRTTTYNWFNTSPAFAAAFNEARETFADNLLAQTDELTALAVKTLRELMEDPKASPTVRLKAAIAILKRTDRSLPATAGRNAEQQLVRQLVDLETELPISPSPDPTPRNAACPCGSGLKFKRCCGVESLPHLSQHAAA